MEITKFKKLSSGRYKVTLDNNDSFIVYEDLILKYNLLITKSIDEDLITKLEEENMSYSAYYYAINSLNSRFKSKYDMEKTLKNKYDIDINPIINKLLEQGYLNDISYTKSRINEDIITTNWGPRKIKSDLLKHGIENDIIDNELIIFTKELEIERIDKIVNKLLKSNKSRGGYVLRTKIFNDLMNLGYTKEYINIVLNDKNYDNSDIYKKEYDKLLKKYSKKYSGNELDYRVKQALYQKGLYYEE